MTLFELVKITLDELYKRAQLQFGAQTDAEIKTRFAYLSESYAKLSNLNRTPIDYRDPATRFAYVYRYVATHGDYVVQLLTRANAAIGGNVFPTGTARVSCIGGGPGSDILAIVKYLADYKEERVTKLKVFLLDKEQAWADTWDDLEEKLDVGCELRTTFQPLDVLKPDWVSQRHFLEADVYTLSYFVSEVYSLDGHGAVTAFWQRLFREAKRGALFLYDDNGTDEFNAYFDGQCARAGLQVVSAGSNESWTPRYVERSDVLDAYKLKFSAWPKLKGYLSYRILRKP